MGKHLTELNNEELKRILQENDNMHSGFYYTLLSLVYLARDYKEKYPEYEFNEDSLEKVIRDYFDGVYDEIELARCHNEQAMLEGLKVVRGKLIG